VLFNNRLQDQWHSTSNGVKILLLLRDYLVLLHRF